MTLDPYAPVIDEPGHVFDGLTLVKARAINDALIGRRVIVVGGRHDERLWTSRAEWVFLRIQLPGEQATTVLDACWDMILLDYDAEQGCGRPGSTRHVSPSLIERLTVVPAPELCPCWNCGRWWPQSELRDVGMTHLGMYEEYHESELECRRCFG